MALKQKKVEPLRGDIVAVAIFGVCFASLAMTIKNMPHFIKPMLTTLVDQPFDDPAWIFEPKWDGFRAIAVLEDRPRRAVLYSRNQNIFRQFAPVSEALQKLPLSAVLDGEIIAADSKGKTSFQILQNYQNNGKGQLIYEIFDLLFLHGKDLRHLPLLDRKKLLKAYLSKNRSKHLRLSPFLRKKGTKVFAQAVKKGTEGIIAKKADSQYLSGQRTRLWLKIKTHLRQEAIIIGFTEPTGGRKYFGSLLLGVYEDGKLKFVGHTGSGFDEDDLRDIHAKLKTIVTKTSPLQINPKSRTKAYWVKPKLVAEISFAKWTSEGIMRQAIFMGLRPDKKPKEVKREIPK
ncbi:MAG: DNA ligase [Candidatus Doudnabacteria bacterium]|nr:DNA ligase [Candidatus Doudnabacteria bacterium]